MDETTPKEQFRVANWAVNEVEQVIARFGRYTKFVVFSKWSLMALAVGLLVTLITVPLVSNDRSGVRVSFVAGTDGKKDNVKSPEMNNPEYRGTSENGDQYKISGLRAIQQTDKLILIEKVEGQLLTESGAWRSLTAESAEYQQDAKLVTLKGNVTLVDEQGYSFVTDSATINTATSEVTGNSPVQGVGPMGNLLASGFKIVDSGKRIIFMGGAERIKLRIDRKDKK